MKKISLAALVGWMVLVHPAFCQVVWQQAAFSFPDHIRTVKADDNGTVIAGLLNNVYYSTDNGTTWIPATNWPGYSPKCIAFNSSHDVFIGTFSNGIYRSTDGGMTFSPINNGLTFMNVWSVAVLDSDDILVGTPGGLFRSVNNGDTWALYGTGLPADDIQELTAGDNGKVFAGTLGSGVYRSLDDGATWTAVNNGLPDTTQVTALLALSDNNRIYVGLFPQGLFMSSDGGDTWTENNDGLPFTDLPSGGRGYSIHTLEQFVFFIFLIIYYQAVYYCPFTDIGTQWVMTNEGLPPDPHVTCVAAGADGNLFLGAYDQGLYFNAYPVGVPDKIPANVPGIRTTNSNPFRDDVALNLSLPVPGNIKVVVYDQFGQQAACLADRMFETGNYRLTWDPGDRAAGIYFCKVISGNTTATIKLIYTP